MNAEGMMEFDHVLEHFRGESFAAEMSVCSTLGSVISLVEEETRVHGLREVLSGNIPALDECVAQAIQAIEVGLSSEYKNEDDAFIAVIAYTLARVDAPRFEVVATKVREARNLWWASWLIERLAGPDSVEKGAKLIERMAADLQRQCTDEVAAAASKEEHLRERAALDAAIATDAMREAVAHKGVTEDERVIADAIGRMRSEPVPEPVPPSKPSRLLVG